MPMAGTELEALLNRRRQLIEEADTAYVNGSSRRSPSWTRSDPGELEECNQRFSMNIFSADAAAGPTARAIGQVTKWASSSQLDSSSDIGLLDSPCSSPRNQASPKLGDEQYKAMQRRRACIWSSRARMCNAMKKSNSLTTEADWLRRLKGELLDRVRRDSDAKLEMEKERTAMEANIQIETMRQNHDAAIQELTARLNQEVKKSETHVKLCEDLKDAHAKDLRDLKQAHGLELLRSQAKIDQLRKNCSSPMGHHGAEEQSPPPTSSEGRLRAALTGHNVPIEELREAVGAVDALLSQAKRELRAWELRERRAAYEKLHAAMGSDKEQPLENAISLARKWGVDAEDLEKAEAALAQLRSRSIEERAAQAAQKRLVEAKRKSFQMVKRGEVAALRELVESGGELEAWRSWKDHAGRTLLAYAQEVGSAEMKVSLERSFAPAAPPEPVREASADLAAKMRPKPPDLAPATVVDWPQTPSRRSTEEPGSSKSSADSELAPDTPLTQAMAFTPHSRGAESDAAASPPRVDPQQNADKAAAFRAVVKDDTGALAEVLERQPPDIWEQWHNKAGKNLLSLSEERSSPDCYIMLARSMGLLQERKFEAFEESETVWVFRSGDVQPVHATVLEDTPSDAAQVLVEFWDTDQPPVSVEHCLVLKTN